MSRVDVVVVGAGILGLAAARELLRRDSGRRVTVIEREERIAAHQTSHTSGVIHAGIYYEPGSLKARLCVKGAAELKSYCAERKIPVREDGKLIVAADRSELPALEELERRGRANRVPGLRRVGSDEIAEIEPAAAGVAALHSPGTAVVSFERVAAALAEDVRAAGGEVRTGVEVRSLKPRAGDDGATVRCRTADGPEEIAAELVVACAGSWSDRLARRAGASADPRVVPFRGAYLRLAGAAPRIRGSVYPVPDPALPFLGAHLTRTIGGDVLLGPTALLVGARDAYSARRIRPRDLASTLTWPGAWRLAARHRRAAITEIRHALSRASLARDAARLIPELEPGHLLPGPAGVRAQALGRDGRLVDDFVIHRTPGGLHVRNAPSPAATSCLALARVIADAAVGHDSLG